MTTHARALVTLTLQFNLSDRWDGSTTADDIRKKASESVLERVYALTRSGAVLVGLPVVTTVVFDADGSVPDDAQTAAAAKP